jgi:hypothetical protein
VVRADSWELGSAKSDLKVQRRGQIKGSPGGGYGCSRLAGTQDRPRALFTGRRRRQEPVNRRWRVLWARPDAGVVRSGWTRLDSGEGGVVGAMHANVRTEVHSEQDGDGDEESEVGNTQFSVGKVIKDGGML